MIIVWVSLISLLAILLYRFKRNQTVQYFECPEHLIKIAYQEINNLSNSYVIPSNELIEPPNVLYIQNTSQFQQALTDISASGFLGVDIEEYRENSYMGYICLLQISASSKVYVIDALKLRKEILALRPVFSNKDITKIFHGCHNDTQWLQRDFGIVCVNVFDTQLAAKALKLKNLGLNHLWKKFCKYTMASDYKKKMQTSRWDLRPLTPEQINYSALDAHYLIFLMSTLSQQLTPSQLESIRSDTNKTCLKTFSKNISEEKITKIFKKLSQHAIDNQSLAIFVKLYQLRDSIAKSSNKNPNQVCPLPSIEKISTDKPLSHDHLNTLLPSYLPLSSSKNQILLIIKEATSLPFELLREQNIVATTRQQKKQVRYQNFIEKYTIKKKVYENCQIQAPDGEILCFADTKKANWYIDRQLATIIQSDPLVIRLNFEPNGRGFSDVEADQTFYSKEKKNQCVACGSQMRYLRFHVVPLLYRQYFPKDYKSHRSHDVVLLCAICHETANKYSDIYKKQIAEEFGVPLNYFGELHKAKEKLKSIKKICMSLIKNAGKIPESRKQFLEEQVKEFIEQNPEYSETFRSLDFEGIVQMVSKENSISELLKVFGDVNWKKELGNSHGKKVVELIKDLKGFIRKWRVNFIETLQPKFLPESWNVDHLLNSPKFK